MATRMEIGVNEAERLRNAGAGAGVVFDFHGRVDARRDSGPVVAGGVADLIDAPQEVGTFAHDGERVTVIGFAAAEQVFRDTKTFSSEHGYGTVAANYWGANILMMDEPDHRKYRALAQPAFAIKTMEAWEQRWLTPMLDQLIDAFPEAGPVDLYYDYCARFPVNTIARGFGIAPDDVEVFHGWVNQGFEAFADIDGYLSKIIEARRADPNDSDVIGLLAQSVVEDETGRHELTNTEILGFANLMLTAGAGTTYRTMGLMLVELLKRPELLARVREDRNLVQPVIEETLRWSPPVPYFPRKAMVDSEVAGVAIPAGTLVEVFVAAANRDPERWVDPHRWNPERDQRAHLTFGFGPHFCIGNQLARMELQVALERLLDRVPELSLDRSVPEPVVTGLMFRMPTAVPAVIG